MLRGIGAARRLLTAIAGTCVIGFASDASAADIRPIYKAPVPVVTVPKLHIGFALGGSWITNLPTASSSGFYSGNTNTAGGLLVGGSVFVDVTKLGNSPALFGSWTLSLGVVVDTMHFGTVDWSGLCGGAACNGTGSLWEVNVIPEVRLMTNLTPWFKVGGYVGIGWAFLTPDGAPTGGGGPRFNSTDSAGVFAVGLEAAYQVTPNLAFGGKIGLRHIFATEFDTTLLGEKFRFDYKNQMIAAFTLTYSTDAPFMFSDIRLKRDVVELARLDNGIGLYRYRYLWSDQTYVGVMAQEVAEVVPGAVVTGADGYLRVDYRQLGLRLMTWDEWTASRAKYARLAD